MLDRVLEWGVETLRTKVIRVVCRFLEFSAALLTVIPRLIYDLIKRPHCTLKNLGEFLRSPFTPFCPAARMPPQSPPDDLPSWRLPGLSRKHPEGPVELLKQGANALEIDVCLTQDGHVVAWHDWDPDDKVSLVRQLGLHPNSLYKPDVPTLGRPRAAGGASRIDRRFL